MFYEYAIGTFECCYSVLKTEITPYRIIIFAGYVVAALAISCPPPSFASSPENAIPVINVGLTVVTFEKELKLHKELFGLIGKKAGMDINIHFPKSYSEASQSLKNGSLDVAFVCGLPYILDHASFGLELLVAPVFHGKTMYQSYLIAPKNSEARSLKDLRGTVFAFSDPLSNSGMLVPNYNLALLGETPRTFFKKYFFTYSHYNSIEAVASRLADGANVDSYVYELAQSLDQQMLDKTKIISKSGHMPITPFVIRPDVPAAVKLRLKKAFLDIASDPAAKDILAKLKLDGFAEIDDKQYDSIRAAYRKVAASIRAK